MKYLIESKECKTLYQISKETRILYPSLELAKKTLLQKNLIELDVKESRKRGRGATIYRPTFKAMLWYLAEYNKLRIKIIRVLERNGKRLGYPLFEHTKTLIENWSTIDVLFTLCAKNLLSSPRIAQLEHLLPLLAKSKRNFQKFQKVEDQILRDSFFLTVLEISSDCEKKLPNQALHRYTFGILQRKKAEWKSTKSLLEDGLQLFGV